MDRTGELISDRYRILSLVGEGGMGAVYLAEHTHMRKRFALKLLHPQMAKNEEVLARFRREAEAAAHVEHPNIVAATDFGQTEDGAFYLVLEYVDGITLRKKLGAGPFAAPRALHVARQIALALERAHGAGVVHRDIKPENVMLVTKGADPDFVKVLDFGVARIDRPAGEPGQLLTQVGTVMGSPSYMAPEQCVGDRVTHRADLYSLGVVLFEMLTGEVPFEGEMMELLTKHVLEPIPTMRDRAPATDVPAPVEAVVRRLLEKEADSRYPTARALVEAIDQAALDACLDVPWGSPRSERALAATSPAPPPTSVIVVPPATPAKRGAPLEDVVKRLEPHLERASAALRPALARVDQLAQRAAARLKLPKAVLLGGLGALVALALVLVIVLATRGPRPAGEGAVAKLLAGREAATQEELRAAATKGPPALEELSLKFPKDAAVSRELVFAYDAAGRSSDALRVVRHMVEEDPKGVPRELVRVVIRAASKVETADEAFRLLEGPLGEAGVDGLMELAEGGEGVAASTRARAQKGLAKPSVRASAPPAVVLLVDLAGATTCEERHAVLARSGKQADGRALTALRALEVKHGCGKKKRFDCNSCLRKDDALADAIQAAQSSAAR